MTTSELASPSREEINSRDGPRWRERRAWLRAFRQDVVRRADELLATAGDEVGKSRFELLATELLPTLASIRWHERHAGRILRPRRIAGGLWQVGQRHLLHRQPMGTVAIIATWNYPIQLLAVQIVQAVAAGNRVVVKPTERAPRTQGVLLDCANRASEAAALPDGWIRSVPATREAGAELIERPDIDHVLFTGSTAVGERIAAALAPRLVTCTLELSGADSAIVLADADPSLAARSIVYGLMLGEGGTCMAPRRVFACEEIAPRFERALAEAAEAYRSNAPGRPGPPSEARSAELEAARGLAAEAVAGGGRWISGAEGPPPHLVALDKAPGAGDLAGGLLAGEHFGPALATIPVHDAEHAVRLHAAVPKKLATAVFTGRPGVAGGLAPRLGSGIVTINDCIIPTGHPGLAITGRGPSGWHPSRGEAGLVAMTRPLHVARTSRRVRVPLDPPPPAQQRGMERFVRWFYG